LSPRFTAQLHPPVRRPGDIFIRNRENSTHRNEAGMSRWKRIWQEDEGVLSFEWTLLTTLVVLGVAAGLSAARDAVIDELGDAAQAMLNLDNSYSIDFPLEIAIDTDGPGGAPSEVVGLASDSSFIDAMVYSDCERATAPAGQPVLNDDES
jgi:hypothetical protein